MKAFRIFCLFSCVFILGYHFYNLNYDDLRSSTNTGHYLGMFAMTFVGFSFLLRLSKDRKKKE